MLLSIAVLPCAGLNIGEDIIEASTGPVVLGEWNKNFSTALAMADEQNIPLLVFYGGVSCGVCETLQRACLTEEFTSWQSGKKILMVFTTDTVRGNARKFSIPEDGSEIGFPYIAAYWNRYGAAPAKHSEYYMCFRGKDGIMPAKGGSLASQLIRSVEMVFGAYPYDGGEFLLPATNDTTRLEVEAGYAEGARINVPLTRTSTAAYVNRLVCGNETNLVEWAEGEAGDRDAQVTLPGNCAVGSAVPLTLLRDDGEVAYTSTVTVVAPQANSLRNPAWLGEDFAAGEWTMDLDAALERARNGEFDYTLLFFTGALWCPHCQGLEAGVLGTDAFKSWCADNRIALVELDNPHRSDSVATNDYAVKTASGASPALLRYRAGSNSYAGRQESGASYLSRKGIRIGDTATPGTAEYVLQRNRALGYAWGEGTYCAPGSGRTGYPTMILLKADGSIAGRFNRLEEDSYSHDLAENMARLDDLLKLAEADGEGSNYPSTTMRTLTVGGADVCAELQVNDSVEYFKLSGLPTGDVTFKAVGGSSSNPVVLSVVRFAAGESTQLAKGTGSVKCSFAADDDCYLKVEAFGEKKRYGADTTFTATVSSSLLLTPVEKTATFTPGGRIVRLAFKADVTYRIAGAEPSDAAAFRDAGAAPSGGRYYTALKSMEVQLAPTADEIAYQIWNPGVIAFDDSEKTVFTFNGSDTISVSREGGSSGAASVRISVVGGDAENGGRYVWDDSTVVVWADGEAGTRTLTIPLRGEDGATDNQTAVFGLFAVGSTGEDVVDGGTLALTLCSTVKPVLPKSSYEVRLFATVNAASALDAQTVFNTQTGGRVSIKATSGRLPSGVKLVYKDGAVALVGSARKPGTYEYVFSLVEKQGTRTIVGPETAMSIVVSDPSDVAAGGNPVLGRKIKATLPLFHVEGGVRVVKGVLEFSMTAKNKIKAQYKGLSSKKTAIKGDWLALEDGVATTGTLTARTGHALELTLDSIGRIQAGLYDPLEGLALTSGDPLLLGTGAYASAYVGSYTASLIETSADDRAGDGYVVVKFVASSGKAVWKGVLANGKSVSGSAYVTIDDDGNAVLPLVRYKSGDYLAAAVRIRPDGKNLFFPRAVKTCADSIARWAHVSRPASVHDCEIRGSYYNHDGVLDACCYDQFFKTNLLLSAVIDGFSSSGRGAATAASTGEVKVLPNELRLAERNPDLKMTFNKSLGVFKGTMNVYFERGSVKAKFAGVVLPGWHDCGCEGPSDPADPFGIDASQPFGRGALWFADELNGLSAKRGFAVVIDESEDD